jgi:hypothetical protein
MVSASENGSTWSSRRRRPRVPRGNEEVDPESVAILDQRLIQDADGTLLAAERIKTHTSGVQHPPHRGQRDAEYLRRALAVDLLALAPGQRQLRRALALRNEFREEFELEQVGAHG